MLTRGDASVKDISPKGWTPLHVSGPKLLAVEHAVAIVANRSSLLPPRVTLTFVLL